MIDKSLLIDNRRRAYKRIRISNGVQVEMDTRVPHSFLKTLDRDVRYCLSVLPPSVHGMIKRTRIWVNHDYCYGLKESPVYPVHSTTHHHEGFLREINDVPLKAYGIEIYNAAEYCRMRLHWNKGLLLHEYCHLIHQVLFGLENEWISSAFLEAKKSMLYENVLRRDWACKEVESDLAYCMIDVKEFFAEMSVTYLAKGFPELRQETEMLVASPEFQCPQVRQRVIDSGYELPGSPGNSFKSYFRRFKPHCNKFYPFTREQLEFHDPKTYETLREVWNEVACWEDPLEEDICCIRL